MIHYVCHPGYFMVGEVKQTCGADGQWVPAQRPECLAKVEKGMGYVFFCLMEEKSSSIVSSCVGGYIRYLLLI